MTSSTQAKSLAFRYLFKTGVVKENTVTLFGETGEVFRPGVDYDEEINLQVPYLDLSNFVLYYGGGIANGAAGSADPSSLRSLNSPVQNIKPFVRLTTATNSNSTSHYYVGDIVVWDPETETSTSSNASCWTCIRTKNSPDLAIPDISSVDVGAIDQATFQGCLGIDNLGQNFIAGCYPARNKRQEDGTFRIELNPYWKESLIAHSYTPTGNYYTGQLAIDNGSVYMCFNTDGTSTDPALYLRTKYTTQQESDYQNGDETAIPGLHLEEAPNGEYGYDSQGTRYIMNIPPSGSVFSALFWKPVTLSRFPSAAYVDLNWDNLAITNKIKDYDSRITGGMGAQSIPEFIDDYDKTTPTLRKVYDDNEAGFVLTAANKILSTIPAAAIKGQSFSNSVQPDNSLLQLVHLAPYVSSPNNYAPAVEGVFEESIYKDMLIVSGAINTIQNIIVTNGSSNYTVSPPVNFTGGLTQNISDVPYSPSLTSYLGVERVKIDKTHPSWKTGRFSVGDNLLIDTSSEDTVVKTAAVLDVLSVNSKGNINSVAITNAGEYYLPVTTTVPEVLTIKRNAGSDSIPYLTPLMEVKNVEINVKKDYIGLPADGNVAVFVKYGSGQGAVGFVMSVDDQGIPVDIAWSKTEFNTFTGIGAVNDGYNIPDEIKNATPQSTLSGLQVLPISEDSLKGGKFYVSTNTKKDIVELLLVTYVVSGTGVAFTEQKLPAEVNNVIAGVIANQFKRAPLKTYEVATRALNILTNSGYTTTPYVKIGPPSYNETSESKFSNKLGGDGTTPRSVDYLFATPFTTSDGIYTAPATVIVNKLDPTAADTLFERDFRTYLGVSEKNMEVRYGGSGYSKGDRFTLESDTIGTSKFRLYPNSSNSAYNVRVVDGGLGYNGESPGNRFVLSDKYNLGRNRDQVVVEALRVGGGLNSVTFGNGSAIGSGWSVADQIVFDSKEVGSTTDLTLQQRAAILEVTKIGPDGVIIPPEGATSLPTTTTLDVFPIKPTGSTNPYVKGTAYLIKPLSYSLESLTLDTEDGPYTWTTLQDMVQSLNVTFDSTYFAVSDWTLDAFSSSAPQTTFSGQIPVATTIFELTDIGEALFGQDYVVGDQITIRQDKLLSAPDTVLTLNPAILAVIATDNGRPTLLKIIDKGEFSGDIANYNADIRVYGGSGDGALTFIDRTTTPIVSTLTFSLKRFDISNIGRNIAFGGVVNSQPIEDVVKDKITIKNSLGIDTKVFSEWTKLGLDNTGNRFTGSVLYTKDDKFQLLSGGYNYGETTNIAEIANLDGTITGALLVYETQSQGILAAKVVRGFGGSEFVARKKYSAYFTNNTDFSVGLVKSIDDYGDIQVDDDLGFNIINGKQVNRVINGTITPTSITGNTSISVANQVHLYSRSNPTPISTTISAFVLLGSSMTITVVSTDDFNINDSIVISGSTFNNGTFIITAVNKVAKTISYENAEGASSTTTPSSQTGTVTIDTKFKSTDILEHKPIAEGIVSEVDEATGEILAVDLYSKITELDDNYIKDTVYTSGGYGYKKIPTLKFKDGTLGIGARITINGLSPTRVEFYGDLDTLNLQTTTDVYDQYLTVTKAQSAQPATAVAIRTGDLSMVNVDQVKNPGLLKTLESLKPGSTDGFAKAVFEFGLGDVVIDNPGTNYLFPADPENDPSLYKIVWRDTEISPNAGGPTPPKTKVVVKDGKVDRVVIYDAGSGFTRPLSGVIVSNTGLGGETSATVTFLSKVVGVKLLSGGIGYRPPPAAPPKAEVTVQPDVGGQLELTTQIRSSIDHFEIEFNGNWYEKTPEAIIVGDGRGVTAWAAMCVSDVQVIDGGAGYAVGDMLEFDDNVVPASITNNTGGGGGGTLDGQSAIATVTQVDENGGVLKVRITPTLDISQQENLDLLHDTIDDIFARGGLAYLEPPKVTKVFRQVGSANLTYGDFYNVDGTLKNDNADVMDEALVDTPAVFSVRLGVKQLYYYDNREGNADNELLGTDFLSDAQLIIDAPPLSQQANYYASIDEGLGRVTAITKITSGSGYEYTPTVRIAGGNALNPAQASANMGVTQVVINRGGSDYTPGDTVTFVQTSTGGECTAKVTSVDGSGSSLGKGAVFINKVWDDIVPANIGKSNGKMGADIYAKAQNGDYTYDDTSVKKRLVGYGGIKKDDIRLLDGGRNFSVGDIIRLGTPVTIEPDAKALIDESIFCFYNSIVTDSVSGKVTKLKLISTLNDYGFKIGDVIKVTHTDNGTQQKEFAFIRINIVEDIDGGWRSTFNQLTTEFSLTYSPYNNPVFTTSGNIRLMDDYSIPLAETYGRALMWGPLLTDVVGVAGNWGADQTILYSSGGWHSIQRPFSAGDFTFEVQRRTDDDIVTLEVTEIGDSLGDIRNFEVLDSLTKVPTDTEQGAFYFDLESINFKGVERGEITFVDIMNTNGLFDPHLDVVTTFTRRKFNGTGAQLTPSFGVVSVTIDPNNRGSGYTTTPIVTIAPPLHRSLKTQGVARSAKLYKLHNKVTAESYGLKVLNKGAGYTGTSVGGVAGSDFGTYQLVGGNLHQTGSSANSTDTIITLTPDCFDSDGILIISEFLDANNIQVVLEGSNYQVGDVLTLVPIGVTITRDDVNPIPIRLEVLDGAVSNWIDYNDQKDTTTTDTFIPNGNNILDSGVIDEATGYDVGGYGTGYVVPPKVRVVGGDQGVKIATTVGLTNVDFLTYEARGNCYKVDDKVTLYGGGFSVPKIVGYVDRVSDKGEILSIHLYNTPFLSCDINTVRLEVNRSFATLAELEAYKISLEVPVVAGSTLTPVFGVTGVVTTIKPTGGFLGRANVKADSPTGYGNIVQPLSAEIVPVFQHEVSKVSVLQDEDVPPLYRITSNPEISIDTPLGGGIADIPANATLFNGWRTMRFNRNDSFEFIVQYVIGKAIAFQVDPDVSLPSSYVAADKIKVAGITIPLRPPGAKGFMGREMSANRIIRRYRIKLIGV